LSRPSLDYGAYEFGPDDLLQFKASIEQMLLGTFRALTDPGESGSEQVGMSCLITPIDV
jgi:hypothetical protein